MKYDDKKRKIDDLEKDILEKDICSDLRGTARNLIMGEGNLDAKMIFIGEAPGKKEDEQGRPFVGASGKFLNEMLEQSGMKREDVYITNIVKYRPPNNRDPKTEEKREFWPYLLSQIEIINPKYIITLGRHSGMAFIPNLVISKDHGKLRKVIDGDYEFTVIPLYHPAAALYNGGLRETLIKDFIQVSRLIKKD